MNIIQVIIYWIKMSWNKTFENAQLEDKKASESFDIS